MSCVKGVPVLTTDRLCDPKLSCSVCDAARKARNTPSRKAGGDSPSGTVADSRPGTARASSR